MTHVPPIARCWRSQVGRLVPCQSIFVSCFVILGASALGNCLVCFHHPAFSWGPLYFPCFNTSMSISAPISASSAFSSGPVLLPTGMPGAGVCASTMPWSKWLGCNVCTDTPVYSRPLRIARSIGAAPLRSGRSEGWTLMPPWVVGWRIVYGINRPNEAAMTRSTGPGGFQFLKFSRA